MSWLHDTSYFFAGAFLTNAVPHLVSGVMGRPFQTPFAKPRGEGPSSSTVNVLRGFFNWRLAMFFYAASETSICIPLKISAFWD
jgi:hypothetical protein